MSEDNSDPPGHAEVPPVEKGADAPADGAGRSGQADAHGNVPPSPPRPPPLVDGRRPRPHPRTPPAPPVAETAATTAPPTKGSTSQTPRKVVPFGWPSPAARKATAKRPRHVVKAARAVPLWLIAGLAVIVVLISLGPLLDRSSPAGTAQRSVTGRGQVTAEPSAPTSASDDGAGTSASTAPAPSEGVPGATSEEVPGATAAPPPGASTASPTGDLGLATPISRPPCDGQWIVLVGATTTPGQYPDGVDHLLQSYPGSHYLLTEGSCASLRQGLPDGSVIYAVYFGPYPTPAAACGMRVQVGDHAYVKVLDDVAPPDRPWKC